MVDRGKKCGESFSGSGRRSDKGMVTTLDCGPRLSLRRRGRGEAPVKPARYGWMKNFQVHNGPGIILRQIVNCTAES